MNQEVYGLLAAKLRDGLKLSRRRPTFMGFLDEGETAFCAGFLKNQKDARYLLWGGYDEAERRLLGIFPDYLEPEESLFPLIPLTFSFRKEDLLSHRDFLGAFMALGIERDVVGDILVEKGRCVAFVREELQDYFCQNLQKIGRVGVRVTAGAQEPLPILREFQELSGVVASERLDCMVAFLCRTSREKAARLIAAGAVLLNHNETLSTSERVKEGDQLSIRKQGKFIIDQYGPLTGKGRLPVKCRKYK